MRVAVISDIHGNIHALQALWADVRAQAPEAVICLGDLVGYGAFPNEVIDFVRERDAHVLMGNYDDGVGYDRDDCGCVYKDPADDARGRLSLLWTRERVTPERKAYLRGLPFDRREAYAGRRVRFVHGSPRKINEYLYEDRPESVFRNVAKAADAEVLFFGHTHRPYRKQVERTLFVNTGSVGKPKDGDPRAGYVLADFGARLDIQFRRVVYDVAAAARAVRESGLPVHFATLLETGGGGAGSAAGTAGAAGEVAAP
jgi:putative phosphoesterase